MVANGSTIHLDKQNPSNWQHLHIKALLEFGLGLPRELLEVVTVYGLDFQIAAEGMIECGGNKKK